MKIGIITAMSLEHEQIVSLLTEKKHYQYGPFSFTQGIIKGGTNTLILMQCGIGKVNSAIGCVELIRYFNPDCIISTGVAGGIDRCLNVMDVVVANSVVYHDVWCGEGNEYGQVQGLPTRFTTNKTLYDCAINLSQEQTTIYGGLICSGDKFITDQEELIAIKNSFPEGLAVDMESCSIAQVCHLYQKPFISFRIISDTPGADKHWEQYTNFWEDMADRSFAITHHFLLSLPQQL